jgi:hypothetical protein
MRKLTVFGAVLLTLAGCGTTATRQYGNFANNPAAYDRKIAADTVKQLLTLYPPAKTRFNLQQPTPDPFGAALVDGLRANGYELREYQAAAAIPSGEPRAAPDKGGKAGSQQATALDLGYVLDQQAGNALYRVTVRIGEQSLTRPYMARNDALVPAGYWVRKE